MNKRNNSLPTIFAAAGLVLLAGCTGMNGGEAVTQAAPVPPPPGVTDGTSQQSPPNTKTQKEDLPDRLFAPLDDSVNDLNRDINREIDSEFPPEKKKTPPESSD
jgi:hypothetical protein